MSDLRLEVGGRYINRNGDVVRVSLYMKKGDFPYMDTGGKSYRQNGLCTLDGRTDKFDLIREYDRMKDDPPTEENADILRGPEATAFLRDNENSRISEHGRYGYRTYDDAVIFISSIDAHDTFLDYEYKCWIEPKPVYEQVNLRIVRNGKAVPQSTIIDLLNKLDPKGEA